MIRRGAAYVFVLGVAMLVTVAGLSVLTVTQINGRVGSQSTDANEAAVLAEDAVEFALGRIAADANWRTTYTQNVATATKPLGRGTVSFKLVDETDSSLSDNPDDPVRLYGIGQVGSATRIYSMQLSVYKPPLNCLEVCLPAGGGITFAASTVLGSSTVTSNGLITSAGAILNATNLEAVTGIALVGGSGTGSRTTPVSARKLPDPAHVFDYYKTNGTTIPLSSVPSRTMTKVLLSPSSNPYSGGTNGQGIYVIDCAGQTFTISACRIVGTLVLLNAPSVTIQTQVNCEPAVSNYPTLMIQGSLAWNTTNAALSESANGVNFNPPSTPYPYNGGAGGGASNATSTDTYPSQISGLVYVSGALTTSNNPTLKSGVLVLGGAWTAGGTADLSYSSTFDTSPPPGFTDTPAMVPVSGSCRWESAP